LINHENYSYNDSITLLPPTSVVYWIIQRHRQILQHCLGGGGEKSFDLLFTSIHRYDSVVIQDKNGNQIGQKLCGYKYDLKVTIPGDKVVVIFKSDDAVAEEGFYAEYTVKQAPPKAEPGKTILS